MCIPDPLDRYNSVFTMLDQYVSSLNIRRSQLNNFRSQYSTGAQCAVGLLGAVILCVGVVVCGRLYSWIWPKSGVTSSADKNGRNVLDTTPNPIQNQSNTTSRTVDTTNRTTSSTDVVLQDEFVEDHSCRAPEFYKDGGIWIETQLAKFNFDQILEVTEDGNTDLHYAIITCQWDMILAILNKAQENNALDVLLRKTNNSDYTPDELLQAMFDRQDSYEDNSDEFREQVLTDLGVLEFNAQAKYYFAKGFKAVSGAMFDKMKGRSAKLRSLREILHKETLL